MEAKSLREAPLVIVVGPTASGKTQVAIELALAFDGEIICADSRTVYKGMDIGTAKPSQEDQQKVPHWGLDLAEPDQRFTAVDFKSYAETKIQEIRKRGRIPFLVGGTGLYIDAVLFNYQFGEDADPELRSRLSALSASELKDYCEKNNITLPKNVKNKRHLIRAIEQNGVNSRRNAQPLSNSIIVGIATEKGVLEHRIVHRTEQLFNDGVVDEAIRLGKKYGWDGEALTGNIYRLVRLYLLGEIDEAGMKEKAIILDRQLAKKQLTWFKRNPFITWLPLSRVYDYVAEQLAKSSEA